MMEECHETEVMLLFIPQTTGNFNQLTDYCCSSVKGAPALCCRAERQRDCEAHTEPQNTTSVLYCIMGQIQAF